MTDEQRWEPMVSGRFLRNVHAVRTPDGRVVYEGETVYGADAATGGVRWWYFNSTGGWIEGTAEDLPEGGWLFEGENHAPAGQTARVRSSSRFDARAADRLHVTTWFWRDDAWTIERELVYARG